MPLIPTPPETVEGLWLNEWLLLCVDTGGVRGIVALALASSVSLLAGVLGADPGANSPPFPLGFGTPKFVPASLALGTGKLGEFGDGEAAAAAVPLPASYDIPE
jgi:hypothetical protein